MSKLLIVLACMVGMTTAGIWDRLHLMRGVDQSRTEQLGDTDRIVSMTRDELQRQKFLLDVLMQVQQPLVDQKLLELGKELIVDQDRYQGQIDDEMLHMIELCRNQRQLGKQDTYTITDDDHVRQMIGLYRMLVRSRDWDTFQRNVCFARNRINEMLFVNSLLLAVRDRQDTRNLIMPAIHEILPELFYRESLLHKAQTVDTNVLTNQEDMQTRKPSLIDMIGMNRRQQLMGQQQLGMLDRRQLWMPWREMRMEMAMRRINGEPMRTALRQEDKLVLPVEQREVEAGMTTLLTTDVGLNDLVHNLINELVVQEQEVQKDDNRNEQRAGLGRVDLRRNEGRTDRWMDQQEEQKDDIRNEQRMGLSRVDLRRNEGRTDRWMDQQEEQKDDIRNEQRMGLGRVDLRRNEGRTDRWMDQRQRTDLDTDDDDDVRRMRMRGTNDDTDRILRVGRRRQNTMMGNDDDDMKTGDRWMQRGRIVDGRHVVDQRDDVMQRQRQQDMLRMRGIDREQDRLGGRQDIDDLPTTTIDDERLLHVNRRHLQDDDMMDRRRTDMNNQRDRFMTIVTGSRISDGRRTVDIDQEWDRDMDMDTWRNRITRGDMHRWTQKLDDDRRMDRDQQERGMLEMHVMGGRSQQMRGNDWTMRRRDVSDLPTTNIDDERLLHVNRRRHNSMKRDDDWRMIGRQDKDMRQRVGDDRRMMWENREQQWRDQRRVADDDDVDTMKWRRTNDDDRRTMREDREQQWRGQRRMADDDDVDTMKWRRTNDDDRRTMREDREQQWRGQHRTDDDDNEDTMKWRRTNDDDRRMMREDREQQWRGQRRVADDDDVDTMKWRRTNDDDHRRQEMDTDNQRDRFMDMVRVAISDGRKILDRDDDTTWTMRQLKDDERMINKNDRRRWGQVGRDDDDDDNDDDVRRMKWDTDRGMETDRWNRRQSLGDTKRDQHQMGMGSGMRSDRLLLSSRQRMRMTDDKNMRDDDRTSTSHRRVPRSLRTDIDNMERRNTLDKRSGERLLHNLQQLVARLNMERIALGVTDHDTDRLMQRGMNNQRLAQDASDEGLALRLNDMRLDTQRNRRVLEQINRVEDRLRQVLDQQLHTATLDNQDDVNRVMGEVLMGRVQDGGILQILRELLVQGRDTHLDVDRMSMTLRTAILRCPVMQHMLRRIVQIVDMQRQQLGAYHRDDIALDGVRINDVTVDELRTVVELDDSDLVNMLDHRVTQQVQDREQVMQKMLVARHQRLNHKTFKINIDLMADRDQRVVIRTMLLPKIDGDDRVITLDEARLNGLLIDATVTDLRSGRNTISRRSRDISWTSRDTTPLTEIYRRVMNVIEGKREMEMEPVVGNNCRLPHRLLLPRGRVEGLPMRMLVVVTPIRDVMRNTQEEMRDDDMCRIGALTKNIDRLPLGFPLDRKIVDETQLISLPNLHLKDVVIYHDDKVSNHNVL